jgi:hypothetical protein
MKRARRSRSGAHGNYAVGYGRPPEHGKFKKGQTGNPKGRPKHSLNLATVLERLLTERIQVTEGGKQRSMTRLEALAKSVVTRCFSGDPKAFANLAFLTKLSGYQAQGANESEAALDDPGYQRIVADFLKRSQGVSLDLTPTKDTNSNGERA